jgi:CMP-N-acetylneuraminic acid synthetase
MDLTEEANLDLANTLPMVYSLDLRKAIASLLELDVSRLVSVARVMREEGLYKHF